MSGSIDETMSAQTLQSEGAIVFTLYANLFLSPIRIFLRRSAQDTNRTLLFASLLENAEGRPVYHAPSGRYFLSTANREPGVGCCACGMQRCNLPALQLELV